MYSYGEFASVEDMLGKTLTACVATEDTITFETSDGCSYRLYHSQDCCESVYIESIVGDLNDLIGNPLLISEEVSGEEPYAGGESYTWTFYKFATIRGYVDVRWLGESNGYYSESVDFRKFG